MFLNVHINILKSKCQTKRLLHPNLSLDIVNNYNYEQFSNPKRNIKFKFYPHSNFECYLSFRQTFNQYFYLAVRQLQLGDIFKHYLHKFKNFFMVTTSFTIFSTYKTNRFKRNLYGHVGVLKSNKYKLQNIFYTR